MEEVTDLIARQTTCDDDDDDDDGKEKEEKRTVNLRGRTDTALIFYFEELCFVDSRLFCEIVFSETLN